MQQLATFWFFTAVIFAVILFAIGAWLSKDHHPFGLLVDDDRKRVSLARLQLVVWTIVIFSALWVLLWDLESVNIYLPSGVWGLLGISVGSTAGAAIIKGAKKESEAVNAAAAGPHVGVLAVSPKPEFSHLFKGDEIDNKEYVDISKVQMFFLTFISVVGYVFAMLHCNLKLKPTDLPLTENYDAYFAPLSTALLTILAISHTGYLTVKAAPHTPTTK